MARRTQRWAPTKAAIARREYLLAMADGRWYRLGERDRQAAHATLIELEERGLVRVDRTRRLLKFQIVYPPELEAVSRWAAVEMRGMSEQLNAREGGTT